MSVNVRRHAGGTAFMAASFLQNAYTWSLQRRADATAITARGIHRDGLEIAR